MSGWYGLYRGVCVSNEDPEGLYRLTALVPQVLGPTTATSWAWPCFPVVMGTAFSLEITGGSFLVQEFGDPSVVSGNARGTLVGYVDQSTPTLPAVGAGVWIGFEGGDENYPYWSGVWLVPT